MILWVQSVAGIFYTATRIASNNVLEQPPLKGAMT
jgi:hypothetical protein